MTPQLSTSEPLPTAWIEKLFERMAALYGSKFADMWRGTDPEHKQLRELLQHLTGFAESRARDRFLKGTGDVFAVEVLPFPTADHLHVLCLDRLDAAQHLNQMALGAGILIGRIPVLTPEQRSAEHGQTDLDRQHAQSDQSQHPAIENHHNDVDH